MNLSTGGQVIATKRRLSAALPSLGWRFTLMESDPWTARRIGAADGTAQIITRRADQPSELLAWLFDEALAVEEILSRDYAAVIAATRRFNAKLPGFRQGKSPAARRQLEARAQAFEVLAWEAGSVIVAISDCAEALSIELPSHVLSEWLMAGMDAVRRGDPARTFTIREYLAT